MITRKYKCINLHYYFMRQFHTFLKNNVMQKCDVITYKFCIVFIHMAQVTGRF